MTTLVVCGSAFLFLFSPDTVAIFFLDVDVIILFALCLFGAFEAYLLRWGLPQVDESFARWMQNALMVLRLSYLGLLFYSAQGVGVWIGM